MIKEEKNTLISMTILVRIIAKKKMLLLKHGMEDITLSGLGEKGLILSSLMESFLSLMLMIGKKEIGESEEIDIGRRKKIGGEKEEIGDLKK